MLPCRRAMLLRRAPPSSLVYQSYGRVRQRGRTLAGPTGAERRDGHDVLSPSSTVAVVRVNFNNSMDASAGLDYRLRTMNYTLSLHTTPGWDDVTGLGSPTSDFLSMFK